MCWGRITGQKGCFHQGDKRHICVCVCRAAAGILYLVDTETVPVTESVRFISAKLLRPTHFDVNDVCRTAASSLWFNHIYKNLIWVTPFWLQLSTLPYQSLAPSCQVTNWCFLTDWLFSCQKPSSLFFFFFFGHRLTHCGALVLNSATIRIRNETLCLRFHFQAPTACGTCSLGFSSAAIFDGMQ